MLIGARRTLLRSKKSAFNGATFSYQGDMVGSNASGVVTFTNVPIGSTTANRFVVFQVMLANPGGVTVSSATVNGSSAGVTVTRVGINGSMSLDLVCVQVPTGTTANLVVTYSGNIFASCIAAAYTTPDVTALSSTLPRSTAFGASGASVTSFTQNINVLDGNSSVIGSFIGVGITNGTQAFVAPNDPGVASDGSFGAYMWGHANAVAANASSRVTVSWTTAGTGNIGLAEFF